MGDIRVLAVLERAADRFVDVEPAAFVDFAPALGNLGGHANLSFLNLVVTEEATFLGDFIHIESLNSQLSFKRYSQSLP